MPYDSEIDIIDLTSLGSFPASDPPSWATGQLRDASVATTAGAATEVTANGMVDEDAPQRGLPLTWAGIPDDSCFPLAPPAPKSPAIEME
ncbi:MAG TPA: hypothetical protein VFL82_06205 [Thermomicrobiales bacterium]|nr:hypothetical protein [Thermomicrobiales bacterium]